MKKHLVIILVAFHLIGSSLYATKTFLKIEHIHSHIDSCDLHEHHHSHSASTHQHKHSHTQINISSLYFFIDTENIYFLESQNLKQTYLETVSWIPNPTSESLFRPPIV